MTDQEKDPVVHSSLSKPLFISSALLVLSLGWGLYDEVYGTRPVERLPSAIREGLFAVSEEQRCRRKPASEAQIKASPEYQQLDRQMQAAEKPRLPAGRRNRSQGQQELVPRALALNEPFQEVRGHVGALTYQIEISKSESSKDSHAQGDRGAEEGSPHGEAAQADGSTEKLQMDFATMDKTLQDWKDEKAALLQKRVDLMKPATELRAKRDKYLTDRISDVSADTLNGLRNKMANFDVAHPPDPRQGCRPGGPLRILPSGNARAGHADQRRPWAAKQVFISHPNKRIAEDPRSREVRLHAVPRRQWRGA